MSDPTDPTPVIRAILFAGFFSGNAAGLSYMAVRGVLLEALWLNPVAMFGAFLGIGLLGIMLGAVCGLSFKLLLEGSGQPIAKRWVPPLLAAACSVSIGLLAAHCAVIAIAP